MADPEAEDRAPEETPAPVAGRRSVMERMMIDTRGNRLLALLALLATAVAGCDKVDEIDHTGTDGTSGATTDGSSSGDDPTGGPPASYPNCLPDLAPNLFPEGGECMGGGLGGGGVGDQCLACACDEPCGSDAQCPTPAGISATGECQEGSCVLNCTGGESCPDGMACVPWLDGSICMWGTTDAFICADAVGGGDPCVEIGDQATCDATVSEAAGQRCMWVEEEIVNSGAATCEDAPPTEGRCLWVEEGAGACESPQGCAADQTNIYWRDLGAGTVALAEIPCPWRVSSFGWEYEPCDLTGDTAIPLVCDCGCG